MSEWLDRVAGPDFAPAVLWTFAALVLLVFVLVAVKLVRSMTFGTFVAGGRNRKTRLAVMDATAVDSHRRLVLVRRDDVEHLILIGGPTDVVVERDIRLGQLRRPALTGVAAEPQSAPQKPSQPEAPPSLGPAPVPVRAPERAPAPAQQASRPPAREAPPQPRPTPVPARIPSPPPRPSHQGNGAAPVRQPPPAPAPPPVVARPPPAARSPTLDDALLHELEVTFEPSAARKPAQKAPELSLDEEMTRLLGELSNQKR